MKKNSPLVELILTFSLPETFYLKQMKNFFYLPSLKKLSIFAKTPENVQTKTILRKILKDF